MHFIKEKLFSNKISLKKIMQYSYLFLIFLMIIPAIYSIVVLNIHTRKYDSIISNVSSANDINLIAKEEIPSELWDIVCGRKEFSQGRQYHLLATISTGINEMKNNILDSTSQEKLEVASRTCLTLSKNIQKLEEQMKLFGNQPIFPQDPSKESQTTAKNGSSKQSTAKNSNESQANVGSKKDEKKDTLVMAN